MHHSHSWEWYTATYNVRIKQTTIIKVYALDLCSVFVSFLLLTPVYATYVLCFYSCSNCNPVNVADAVTLKVECEDCQKIVWYFESTEDFTVSVFYGVFMF